METAIYNEIEIHFTGQMMNLTNMWKAWQSDRFS